jgi:endonuclease G
LSEQPTRPSRRFRSGTRASTTGGVATAVLDDLLQSQRSAAEERFRDRRPDRKKQIEAMGRPDGLVLTNSPERVAKRIDRVIRLRAGEIPPQTPGTSPQADPQEVVEAALERAPDLRAKVGTDGTPETVLEKIINTVDFVDIRYLEAGVAAARAVARVNIRDGAGRPAGYGSGSLVSPRLLLTNHHVLSDAEVARSSVVEFNYQDGLDGQPLQSRVLELDPEGFFLCDQERDFALVAVKASEQALAEFGFNRLIEAEGKALVGEFVTIVQHPRGERKRVALRENRIVDLLERFVHYEADTEPGSSGSPVFNDQWEVVALHHASVRAPKREEFGEYLNEGIRVSRIIKFVREQPLSPAMRTLLDQMLTPERIVVPAPTTARTGVNDFSQAAVNGPTSAPVLRAMPAAPPAATGEASLRLSLPLEITVRLGAAESAVSPLAGPSSSVPATSPASGQVEEAVQIDPDYASRRGYDADFLGTGEHRVPLPMLSEEQLASASTSRVAAGATAHVLPYHHFSVVMNRERRLAYFTAVNIDGALSRRIKRERDRWSMDPRLPAGEQAGEAVYEDNDLDRGHLVRRLDPAWGTSPGAAKVANDDTFHYTNCTPQHRDFNQNRTTWAGLEDYILENADNRDLRVSVFTGPVFAEDDDDYRGVKLPRQYWKVVVIVKESGELSATGYLLSQAQLIANLEAAGGFNYGAYRTYQVPIRRIEELTGLSFGTLTRVDPRAGLEAMTTAREIGSLRDIVL